MWSIAKAQAALILRLPEATERTTFGERVADRQGIQWMLAECAERLYVTRLTVLHIAYMMETGKDLRQVNSIAKNYIAHALHHIIDTAIQIHGSLGTPTTHHSPRGTPRCEPTDWSTAPTRSIAGWSAQRRSGVRA